MIITLSVVISHKSDLTNRKWYVELQTVQARISCTKTELCVLNNEDYYNQTIVYLKDSIASLKSRNQEDTKKVAPYIVLFEEELRMLKNNKSKLQNNPFFLANTYPKDIEKYNKVSEYLELFPYTESYDDVFFSYILSIAIVAAFIVAKIIKESE